MISRRGLMIAATEVYRRWMDAIGMYNYHLLTRRDGVRTALVHLMPQLNDQAEITKVSLLEGNAVPLLSILQYVTGFHSDLYLP